MYIPSYEQPSDYFFIAYNLKQALEKYTPRQLRFFFLLHQWDTGVDFRDTSMSEAMGVETTFNVSYLLSIRSEIKSHVIAYRLWWHHMFNATFVFLLKKLELLCERQGYDCRG
jgi:cysteinyl-tRNA synthetase